jgi:hypothetical protein
MRRRLPTYRSQIAFARGASYGVWITSSPHVLAAAWKAGPHLVSLSQIKRLAFSPNGVASRNCCATQPSRTQVDDEVGDYRLMEFGAVVLLSTRIIRQSIVLSGRTGPCPPFGCKRHTLPHVFSVGLTSSRADSVQFPSTPAVVPGLCRLVDPCAPHAGWSLRRSPTFRLRVTRRMPKTQLSDSQTLVSSLWKTTRSVLANKC